MSDADSTRTAPDLGAATRSAPPGDLDATRSHSDRPPVAPADLPGYVLHEPVGNGAFGTVYRATQTRLGRVVAVKVLRDGPSARFLAEAEAAAAVHHPHVVQVYDYGEAAFHGGEARPFLAMEYLPGGTLSDRLKRDGAMATAAAAALLAGLARAVHAAHERGVVHRDVKPGNVLFDAAGAAKVADFGLAKLGDGADLTRTGAVFGTPAYMAPEQASGGGKFAGPPADVWALGVVLYECLTGTRPFDAADTLRLLRLVEAADPEPPRRRRPDLPRDLDTVCLKCLAKEPADRYPSAAALADDLDRFGRGEPVSVRPPGTVERAVKWARRNPSRAAALFATAVAVVFSLALFAMTVAWAVATKARWRAEDAQGQTADANQRLREAKEGLEGAVAERDRAAESAAVAGRKLAVLSYARTLDLAYRECQANNLDRALKLLGECDPAQRGWEWDTVARLCRPEATVIPAGPGDAASVMALSPDGARVATGSADGFVRVAELSTGRTLARIDAAPGETNWLRRIAKYFDTNVRALGFLDGGRQVFTENGEHGFTVWDVATGTVARRFPTVGDAGRLAAASADGRRLAVTEEGKSGYVEGVKGKAGLPEATQSHRVRLFDTAAGKEVRTLDLPRSAGSITAVALSPDGLRLATACGPADPLRLWDAETGKPLAKFGVGAAGDVTALAFSPDGKLLLAGVRDGMLVLLKAGTGETVGVLAVGDVRGPAAVGFTPDGLAVVASDADRAVGVWDVGMLRDDNPRAETVQLHAGCRKPVVGVGVTPDGRRLVAADESGAVRTWDLTAPPNPDVTLTPHPISVEPFAVSPDGRRALGPVADQPVGARIYAVWDVAAGKEICRVAQEPPAEITFATFAPDGAQMLLATKRDAWVADAATGRRLVRLRVRPGDGDAAGEREVAQFPPELDGEAVLGGAFSPDGARVLTAERDGAARLWDAATGALVRTLPTVFGPAAPDVAIRVEDRVGIFDRGVPVAFSPDGARAVVAGSPLSIGYGRGTPRLAVWNLADGTAVDLPVRNATGVPIEVDAVAFGPDGRHVAAAPLTGEVVVWDAATGREAVRLTLDDWHATALTFSPDGRRLLAANAFGKLLVWDAATGTDLLATAKQSSGVGLQFTGLHFAPDGRRLVGTGTALLAGRNAVCIWNASPRPPLTPPPAGEPGAKSP